MNTTGKQTERGSWRDRLVRFTISLALCALLVLIGIGVTMLGASLRKASKADAAPKAPAQRVTSVNVQVLKPVTVLDRLVLTGKVEPWTDVIVSGEASGPIDAQPVKEGDKVKKGQELIRVDTSLLRAQYDQARSQQTLASRELKRVETLSAKGVVTGQNLDRTATDRDMAAASLRLMEIRLNKSVISAPIDGIVDKLFKDEGEFADTGQPLVRIVQTDKVKVFAGIPERDIAYFAKGNSVKIKVDALADKEFQGTIYKLATTAEPSTLTFVAEIQVDNPEGLLRPGMIARAALVRREFADSIAIPIFSILSLENQRFVMVEDNGKARMRPIEVGVLQGKDVQVTKGLAPGDRLIVAGQRDLRDGEAVNVLEVLQ